MPQHEPMTLEEIKALRETFSWLHDDEVAQNSIVIIDQLIAEVERLRSFDGCDGCATGDCPHENVNECVQSQGKAIVALTAEVERMRAEADELRDALRWCSGSADFGPGGQAEEGWRKVQERFLTPVKETTP